MFIDSLCLRACEAQLSLRAEAGTVASRCSAGLSAYAFQLLMTMGLRRVKAAPAAATLYLKVVWGLAAGILVSGLPVIFCRGMSC